MPGQRPVCVLGGWGLLRTCPAPHPCRSSLLSGLPPRVSPGPTPGNTCSEVCGRLSCPLTRCPASAGQLLWGRWCRELLREVQARRRESLVGVWGQ